MENDREYLDLVNGWVAGIAHRCRSFEDFLFALPGVYPTTLITVLKCQVAAQRLPESVLEFREWRSFSGVRNALVSTPRGAALPVPHPLDYDWRFSPAAAEYLLECCEQHAAPGDNIICIGTPTFALRALQCTFPRQITLLDKNRALLESFQSKPNGQMILCDVSRDTLPTMCAPVVVLDPPWYSESMKLFLWAASKMCVIWGRVLIAIPPLGTRPGVDQEWGDVLRWAERIGLALLKVERGVLPYLSPPFELAALAAEGIPGVPVDWRRGDLAVFKRVGACHEERPYSIPEYNKWVEERLHGTRIRIRTAEELSHGFETPALRSIFPTDVFPSVSRRDPRRSMVDVWTAGNRVFQCQGRHILRLMIRAVHEGLDPVLATSKVLARDLQTEEVASIRDTEMQLHRLAESEPYDITCEGHELVAMGG